MNAQQYACLLRNSVRRRGPAALADGIARTLRKAANAARRRTAARMALERVLDPELFTRVDVASFRDGVVTIVATEEVTRRRLAQQRATLTRDLSGSLAGVIRVRVIAQTDDDEIGD